MKNTKQWIGAGAAVLAFLLLGSAIGFLATLAISPIFVAWWVWAKLSETRKLKKYGARYENLYLVTCHPDTDEQPNLGDLENVPDLVHYAPYGTLGSSAEKHRKLLIASGNKFYTSKHLRIIPIIFQDGVNVNENWGEFGERAQLEIKQDRAQRHGEIQKKDPGWYMAHSNKERQQFDWERG